MQQGFFKYIKISIPLPWDYLEYVIKIIKNTSIDSNAKNKWYIISAFFMSITFSGFLASLILDLKFDFSNSIHIIELTKLFIYNAVPLAIIYSIIMSLIVAKYNLNKKDVFNFFLQIVKFFTLANVVVAIEMLIAIDQLVTQGINVFKEAIIIGNPQNQIVIFCTAMLLYAFLIYHVVFKPTSIYLSQFYSWSKASATLILVSTVYINSNLYSFSFYPKINQKNLVIPDKFCDDILKTKLSDNKNCKKVTFEERDKIKQQCLNIIDDLKNENKLL